MSALFCRVSKAECESTASLQGRSIRILTSDLLVHHNGTLFANVLAKNSSNLNTFYESEVVRIFIFLESVLGTNQPPFTDLGARTVILF